MSSVIDARCYSLADFASDEPSDDSADNSSGENADGPPNAPMAALLQGRVLRVIAEAPEGRLLMLHHPLEGLYPATGHRSRPTCHGASCTGTERRPSGELVRGRNDRWQRQENRVDQ